MYEVNLEVQLDVADDFKAWLKPHVAELLALPGFLSAEMLAVEADTPKGFAHITMQYRVDNREHLQDYFDVHAARLRGDGIKRFGGKMTAHRRVLISEYTDF